MVQISPNNEHDQNALDRCVLLHVSIGKFGVRRKIKASEIKIDADPKMVSATKKIMESKEYDAICKADGAFSRHLSELTLPSMFKDGIYLVPLPLLDRIDSDVSDFLANRETLIDAFISKIPKAIEEAPILLKSLFDSTNYPTMDAIKAKFTVEYRYFSTATPQKLANIRSDIFQRETEKAHAEIQSMTENIKSVLRESVRDMLAHAAEKLTPKPDGSSQIFRDTLIGNIRSFLETFQQRNIANDADLADICSQVDMLLLGVTPEALRKDSDMREEIRKSFEGLTQTLDGMLVDRPRRKIRTMETENAA